MERKNSKKNDPRSVADRHLDVPSEANRDKHVNFVAQEEGDEDPGSVKADENKLLKNEKKRKKK